MTDTTLTVDQAVAELIDAPVADAVEEQEQAPAETSEETPVEPNPTDDASEAAEEAEPGDGEDAEPDEPAEAEAVEAPQWWDAEAKAHFASLTPDLQAVVRAQEDKREAVVAKAKTEASEVRKAADGELQHLAKVSKTLTEWLPQAVERFNNYWGPQGFDLQANIQEHGLEQALIFQDQYQKDTAALHQVTQAKAEADQQARVAWQREQREALKEVCPELTDPREGKNRERELASYLIEQGATPEDLEAVPAWAIAIANKAHKFDKAQAAAKAKSIPNPKPITPALKPTAATAQSSQSRSLAQLKARADKTGSMDDMVALMVAEEKAQRRA
jgi:hypothetical protein